MPDDEDTAADEKRLYGTKRAVSVAYVAADLGVATLEVSGDQVGRFHLEHRCTARDVATDGDRLAVATADDVLVASGDAVEETGFGPAVAVGVGTGFVAAAPDGTVARREDGAWTDLGTVADVRAIDGDLLAAAGGVYRLPVLEHAGLSDVRDVSAAHDGAPLAATGEALYRLGPGWQAVREGAVDVVTSDGDRAHAVTADGALLEREGEWRERDAPTATPLVDLAYGECLYGVTGDGTFVVDADPETTPDGQGRFRTHSLGLTDAAALAVATV